MANQSPDPLNNAKGLLANLLEELNSELKQEQNDALSDSKKKINEVAKSLLQPERDLLVPGANKSEQARIDRLLQAIEREDF